MAQQEHNQSQSMFALFDAYRAAQKKGDPNTKSGMNLDDAEAWMRATRRNRTRVIIRYLKRTGQPMGIKQLRATVILLRGTP